MTKQETIAKAYGEHWETVKDFVDENGLIRYDNYKYFKLFLFDRMVAYDSKGVFWIPKSLKGIENNNGWIKIESEADLPKDDEFKFNETFLVYYCCKGCSNMIFKGSIDKYTLKFRDITNKLEKEKVTHYQPIVKPEPPIY